MSIRDTIAENFRDLPLNDLIREAQQPSGKYRLYDILGQIQLKKNEVEKAAASQIQAPQTTVVQDLQQFVNTPPPPPPGVVGLPQAQPMMQAMAAPPEMPVQQMAQGGLADLDVGDMFNEQSYANGGIVAFDDGGEVNHYAEGGEVQHFVEGGTSRLGDYFRNLRASNLEKQEENKLINQLLSEKYRIQSDIFSKLTPEQKAAQENALKQIDAMLAEAKAKKASGASNAPTTIPGANVMGSQAAADKMFATQYDPSQSIGYKGAPAKEAPSAAIGSAYNNERVQSIGDYAKELQDFLGPDKNLALQRERLAKMDSRVSRMDEQAPWLALLEAGLGTMAGTSPFALTNIGAGAQMGVKSYANAQDRLAALEERRMILATNMDQAERREKLAVAEFGARSKEATRERNLRRELQKEELAVRKQMNADDNIRALQAAAIKNQPDITQTLKLNEYIEERLPQEKELILEDLGGNADKRGSKNHDEYLKRVQQARAKLANQARTIPGVPEVTSGSVTTPRARFLGFE